MGTSSSNRGPRGRTSLLPSWADGDYGGEGGGSGFGGGGSFGSDTLTRDWSSAKTTFSRAVKSGEGSGGSGGAYKKALRGYVKTAGGSGRATTSARRGVSIGGGLIDFFSDVQRVGAARALENFGLAHCIGKNAIEVLLELCNQLAPTGATNEEAIARKAFCETNESLLKNIDLDDGSDALEKLSVGDLKSTVIEFAINYIFQKLMYELGSSLERSSLTEQEVIKEEREMRSLVRHEVIDSMKSEDILKFDLKKGAGRKIVDRIFKLAYATIADENLEHNR